MKTQMRKTLRKKQPFKRPIGLTSQRDSVSGTRRSGLIGLDPCAAPSASTRHKTSTTSEATSLAAMHTFSHTARWHPALNASLSLTPRPSRSTCSSSTPSCPSQTYSRRRKACPAIARLSGISVEGVDSQPRRSLQSRSISFSSTWTTWQSSTLVTDCTSRRPPL